MQENCTCERTWEKFRKKKKKKKKKTSCDNRSCRVHSLKTTELNKFADLIKWL